MFGIGAGEFVIILIAALILFGPSKLPEVGRMLGKGLRELKKAQAALSETLNEVSVESEKKSSTQSTEKISEEKKSEVENKKISVEKKSEVEEKNSETDDKKISDSEKISAIKNLSADEKPPHSALTVDDVINLAKENPFQNKNLEENLNEKISDTAGDSVSAASSSSNDNSRINSDSIGK